MIGETLYYIIGQPKESTKNLKRCISICLTKVLNHPLNNQGPNFLNLEFLESTAKWKVFHVMPWKPSSNIPKYNCFALSTFWKNIQNPSIFSCVWPTTRNPNLTSSNTFLAVNNDKNVKKYLFLLSFTQLSIWSNNFFGNVLGPTLSLGVFNSLV